MEESQIVLAKCGESNSAEQFTVTMKLQRKRDQLQEQLDGVNRALRMLEATPQVQQVLDCLSKIGGLYY